MSEIWITYKEWLCLSRGIHLYRHWK